MVELVTVRELIEGLVYPQKLEDIAEEARRLGWLDELDVSTPDAFVERRQAARILHEYLRKVCGEKELEKWESAKVLLDLYDCRSCVNHVAQIYSKGIMNGILDHVFGMREGVLIEELEPILNRINNPECRLSRIE